MDQYLSRMWCRRHSSLYQGKNCEMRSWQLMAGWPSSGMRLLTFSLLKPNFPLSSRKPQRAAGWLLWCIRGAGLFSLHWSQAREQGGQALHRNPSKPLTLRAPGHIYSQQKGASGIIPPTLSLRGRNQSHVRGSSLLNWSHCQWMLRLGFQGSFYHTLPELLQPQASFAPDLGKFIPEQILAL